MFFKKKQEVLGDQLAVYQEREDPRFAANGGITIEGFEGEGLLKNICISGCCMESVTYAALLPAEVYKVKIIPAADISLDPFSAALTASWTKSSEMSFEAGFSLEAGRKNPHLEKYVEYLKMKGVTPEYGNMSHDRRS
jgi:hypothetical protein